MVDDVFQLVRIGKHVDATAPLARWLNDTDPEHVSKDAYYVAEQALRWESPPALNTIGSTLIRHLMRYGRPDAALAVFEILRSADPTSPWIRSPTCARSRNLPKPKGAKRSPSRCAWKRPSFTRKSDGFDA